MRLAHALRLVLVLTIGLLTTVPLEPQGLESVRARYTKQEFYVPMRDGVRLFTAVYTPKDRSKVFPILLRRTPYSLAPYGVDRYPAAGSP